jgi:two-component system cell cycle response regulator DivK
MADRLLLIEDDQMIREILSRWLARHGYVVVTAPDGIEGLSIALAERPDLILLDLRLPKQNGWELARRLKSTPETSAVPIIAVTAFAFGQSRERALAAGCDDYEAKPVDFPRLLSKIEALLHRDARDSGSPPGSS